MLTDHKQRPQERFRPASMGFVRRVRFYIDSHYQSMVWATRHFLGSPLSNGATVIVIALALALPLSLSVLLSSTEAVVGNVWQQDEKITVFLVDGLSSEATQHFIQTVEAARGVAKVQYISPEQGLAELSQKIGMEDALKHLEKNPLPGVVEVLPVADIDPAAFSGLVVQFKGQSVVSAVQTDMGWMKRLYWMMALGERILWAFALLLCLGVLLIVGNTIRLMLREHAVEMGVLSLLGATRGYIRRPYLYLGILLGGLGSALACLLIFAFDRWLALPLIHLSELYHMPLVLMPLSAPFVVFCVIGGAFLGLLGARFTAGQEVG